MDCTLQNLVVIDAVRITDGAQVVLKRVEHPELAIIRYLTSSELRSDPRNRTVHLLDEIALPEEDRVIIVMPMLRLYYTPPFQRVGQILDAIRQFLTVSSD